MTTPQFFKTPAALRAWFSKNHRKVTELWLGFYKKDSGKPSVTWPEAVDQALCFGWIDGRRKSLGDESYMIRFSPRKPGSKWSKINLARVKVLTAEGLMKPAGLEIHQQRDPKKAAGYSFEEAPRELDEASVQQFSTHKKAWEFFQAQPPGYRRVASFWVMSAKKPETRLRRLALLIEDSSQGLRLAEAVNRRRT